MPAPRPRSTPRSLAALAAATILSACALGPLQIDRAARAPVLSGYGESSLSIAASPEAGRWFAQGMEQAYAFNEVEAVRSFKAALAVDPSCAMCAWGVAWQLGPNINNTDRGDLSEARRYAEYAAAHAGGVSERDRRLIEAAVVRYAPTADSGAKTAPPAAPVCGAGGKRADPLDLAYAERMRAVADRFPADPDVLSIYAEAEMIATPADFWWNEKSGQATGRIGDVAERLEDLLKTRPEHVGLNHYLIHAVDEQVVAARAEGAADRLGRLAASSPHLLHMPSHTYIQIGRYADASSVNVQALAADEALRLDLKGQGFSISKDWRSHDSQFLWYAALMEGRGELALETARASAGRANGSYEYAEFVRSRPILTLLRLERWDDVLSEPLPSGDKGMAAVIGQYAHGVALARTGQPARATEALALLQPVAEKMASEHTSRDYIDRMGRGIALVTLNRLRAEIALSEGRNDEALAAQTVAVTLSKDLDNAEPPILAADARLALGDLQLRSRRWSEAEQTFRADLALHPKSGWALRGLARSLRAQGRAADADALKSDIERVWRSADTRLLAAAG